MDSMKIAKLIHRIARRLLAYNKQGYGAWVDDKGKTYDVQMFDHDNVAKKLFKERGIEVNQPDNHPRHKPNELEAFKQGWSRVVWYKNNLSVEYNSDDVSSSSLSEVKSLIKDYEWDGMTVELADKNESISPNIPREALLFINQKYENRPPKKKQEVQKTVEESLERGVEKTLDKKEVPEKKEAPEKKSDGGFTDAQENEWGSYKKEHPATKFKNIKEYFDAKEKGGGTVKERSYEIYHDPSVKKRRRRKYSFIGVDEVAEICPQCAENMKKAGISRISENVLKERGRIGYGWADLPKGWTKESVKKFWNTLTGDKQHKVTECISRMTKHFGDGAGGFCAGLADMANPHGPAWRFGPRKKKTQSEKESSIALKILTGAYVRVDINDTGRISPSLKNKANKAVFKFLKPTYFNEIPLDGLFKELRGATDIVVVQEDGTEWSGILTGRDGEANFDLGYEGKLVSNASLRLTWHKMESGRYEVIGYVA